MSEISPNQASPTEDIEFEASVSFQLSGVQCLPDFTDNITSVVSFIERTGTRLETFAGDRVQRVSNVAQNVGKTIFNKLK